MLDKNALDAMRDALNADGVSSAPVRSAAAATLQQIVAARRVAAVAGVPQDPETLLSIAQVIATNQVAYETRRAG